MEVFNSAVIMQVMNKHLSLRDIMEFMCTCKHFYSKEWQHKMETALCLLERVNMHWNTRLNKYDDDPMDFTRKRILGTLERLSPPFDFVCWIAKCAAGKVHNHQLLATVAHFTRTTCVNCAANSVYWKRNFTDVSVGGPGVNIHEHTPPCERWKRGPYYNKRIKIHE